MAPRILMQLTLIMVAAIRSLFADRADLAIEYIALRQQVAALKRERPHPRLDDLDRAFLVALKEKWSNWINGIILVTPDTVVRWQKERFRKYWAAKSKPGKRPGRPAVNRQIRDLIRRMARENDWGAPRIHAELLKLGLAVSQATVSRYLPRLPAPDKVERWKKFLRNHLPDIAAMDFFAIPTASFKLLYGFLVIHHDRRRILHINVTESPTARWVIQQLREAFPGAPSAEHLIHDRDSKFSAAVRAWIKALGLESVQTAFRTPLQNAIAERLVLSIRTELLDHVVVINEAHARRLLVDWTRYYGEDRCHLSLNKDCPEPRPVQPRPPGDAEVVAFPRVGGIHPPPPRCQADGMVARQGCGVTGHRYEWKQAA